MNDNLSGEQTVLAGALEFLRLLVIEVLRAVPALDLLPVKSAERAGALWDLREKVLSGTYDRTEVLGILELLVVNAGLIKHLYGLLGLTEHLAEFQRMLDRLSTVSKTGTPGSGN